MRPRARSVLESCAPGRLAETRENRTSHVRAVRSRPRPFSRGEAKRLATLGSAEDEARLVEQHRRAWRDAVREPHVAPDGTTATDGGVPAEDGRAGVNGDVVLDGGMALLAARFLAPTAHAQRAQRHALIDPH